MNAINISNPSRTRLVNGTVTPRTGMPIVSLWLMSARCWFTVITVCSEFSRDSADSAKHELKMWFKRGELHNWGKRVDNWVYGVN